jgi:hypothetical protein
MRINEPHDDDFEAIEESVRKRCTPEYLAAELQEVMLRVNGYPGYCPGRTVLRRRRR